MAYSEVLTPQIKPEPSHEEIFKTIIILKIYTWSLFLKLFSS